MNQTPNRRRLFFATIAAALFLTSAAYGQVAFDKSFSPSTVGPGSSSTLTFTLVNTGGTLVEDLAFTDNLPAGLTVAGAPKASTTCPGFPTLVAVAGGTSITFSGPGLGPGGSCSISVDVTATTTPGTYTNNVTVTFVGGSDDATAALIVATDRPGFSKSCSAA